ATGFWYYFPVVLSLKTPLGTLALAGLAPWLLKERKRAALAATFSLAILLVAMCGRIDIGVRHVLPVYAGLSVLCAAVETRGWLTKIAVALLMIAQVVSGDLSHPDYLAYTNEI